MAWYNFRRTDKTKKDSGIVVDSFDRKNMWFNAAKYDYSQPLVDRYATTPYMPFGIDNLYPNHLTKMYNGSPFHNAVIEFKIISAMGDGLDIIVNKKGLEGEILKKKLENKFNRSFMKRMIRMYLIHNRLYIKSQKNTLDFEIIDSEYVRVSSTNNDKLYLNFDWEKRRSEYKEYDIFDKYDKNKTQIIEYNEVSPGFVGYSVPTYTAASNWIWLDSEIAFSQKQNLENAVNPAAIIKFYQDEPDPEKKQKFINDFKRNFEGAKNSGKTFIFFSNGKDLSPDYIPMESNHLDKTFVETQENIINNVSYSHLVNPVIMGVATPGKLGQTNEIENAYILYVNNFLDDLQSDLNYILNDILHKLDIDASIYIRKKDIKLIKDKEKDNKKED